MKKYTEILQEITNARASMRDTAATEKTLDREALRAALTTADPEAIEQARAAYKATEARYITECEHNDNIKIKIEILKDNAAQALFIENIAIICEIWNKYEGKPHGEKTAAKIRDEIKAATGLTVCIGNSYFDAHITIYFYYNDTPRAPFDRLEIIPIWNGEKQSALDSNNKIVKLNPENMRVYNCGEYVEDVDAHVIKIREAHAAAITARDIFQNAVSLYNDLTRGNMQHADTREGVRSYII